ncbi:MAG: 4Fe-4S binding protein [Methanomicrobiales archaeon]|nr:4Fe-4S binding protein [Methanomicrobiales archaeon]
MKLLVNFSRKRGSEPIIAKAVKETGVLIMVDRAQIDPAGGQMLIDVPRESCRLVSDKMGELGADVRILEHAVTLDMSECVDCGACISVCPREVFTFDAGWRLSMKEDRCVLCGRCVPACPHRALSVLV